MATSRLQHDGTAREHIVKELNFNASLATHQRTVLETAIAFIDQLGQGVSSGEKEDDAEEEENKEKVDTELSKGELLGLVIACEFTAASESVVWRMAISY